MTVWQRELGAEPVENSLMEYPGYCLVLHFIDGKQIKNQLIERY